MSHFASGAATLPKGFRFNEDDNEPSRFVTPEPTGPTEDAQLPSPPRQRLRLKRRVVSHPHQLSAPTQQFLASVAAVDVPLPSVEEPEIVTDDHDMLDSSVPQVHVQDFEDTMDIYHHIQARKMSPPKTPALELPLAPTPSKYPDWSLGSSYSSDVESTPDYESSRPSTAFSTHTSGSIFSRYSFASEDEEHDRPDMETDDDSLKIEDPVRKESASRDKSRKAPWTKAMTNHLWSTYMLYLQDPRVTPIRLDKSCIPPHGVCLRVSRQAKRSWRGANNRLTVNDASRELTPTAESSKPFIQWPHTCAATRAHLRDLCRHKGTNKPGRYQHTSNSPTPISKAIQRRWNRRSVTPARSPSIFSSRDLTMSLTMSTSDAMQPQGPLAQLTSSPIKPEPELEPFPDMPADLGPSGHAAETQAFETIFDREPVKTGRRYTLGSPFMAKSYGPSSSTALAGSVNIPRQSNTLGARKLLRSPVRLTRSRSGTQKRRSAKSSMDAIPRIRPSLTAAFGKELADKLEIAKPLERQETPVLSTPIDQIDDVFGGGMKSARQPSPNLVPEQERPFVVQSTTATLGLSSRPDRLGSPFMGKSTSYTLPNRVSSPVPFNLTALRRPFATVQQPSLDADPPVRSSLASRLAYLDRRLKDFRNRDRTRSQSPL